MAKEVKFIEDRHNDKKPTKVGGFKAKDLFKAPLSPPEPVRTEGKEATNNKSVLILIAGALILGICGLFLVLFGSGLFGGFLLLIAALLVVGGVFLPVH